MQRRDGRTRDAAIDLLAAKEPLLNKDIEKQRLIYVYKTLIETPEARELGVGDIKDARMTEAIDDHRGVLRAAAQARGRRRVQPRLPAAQGRSHAETGN